MDYTFLPGDHVIIKDWGEMAAEYGVSDGDNSYIHCPYIAFVEKMKYLCGVDFIVPSTYRYDDNAIAYFQEGETVPSKDEGCYWTVSKYMVKLVSDSQNEAYEMNEEFLSFINEFSKKEKCDD